MELTAEEVRRRAQSLVDHDFAILRNNYLAENGMILDSDRAKELFPDYAASLTTRRKYSSAVYPPAARFIDRLYGQLLQEPLAAGKQGLVVCTAGGPGSGKSAYMHTAEIAGAIRAAALVLDGTFSDFMRSRRNVDDALKAGFAVHILFVYRPLEDCLRGVWERAIDPRSGRATPFRTVVEKHRGALETVHRIEVEYQDQMKVSLLRFRFDGLDRPMLRMSKSELESIPICDLASSCKLAQAVLNECERAASPNSRDEAQSLRAILAEGLG